MNLTRVALAAVSSMVLMATLAACGGGGDDATAAGGQGAGAQEGAGPGRGGPGGVPGTFGEVAAVSGSTAQVQNQQAGQVAVTWTGSTTFTQQVSATLADVKAGTCVMVTSADPGADASASEPATEVVATSVRIVPATAAGGCTFGGGRGQRPSGVPSDRPSRGGTPPSGAPSDGTGRRFGGFGTFGEVSAVSGAGFTVTSTGRDVGSNDSAAASVEVTVTVTDDTSYTTTAKASAAAVKVGRCLQAQGDADDTGAVTATSIAVSAAVDGECTGGGGRGAGRPGGAS